METVIVAAYAPELDGIPEGSVGATVGVGLVDAAAGAAAMLAAMRPQRVILIGTCGARPGFGLARGDLVTVVEARWTTATPGVAVPEVVPRVARADDSLVRWLARTTGARPVVCACSEGVTVVDTPPTQEAVEHMECFAVFRACSMVGVPAGAIFAVANAIGPDARAEWRANHVEAEAAAVRAVGLALSSGWRLPT